MKSMRSIVLLLATVFVWSFLAGCDGSGGGDKADLDKNRLYTDMPGGNGVVFGTVVDLQTGVGIPDATVTISIGNKYSLTAKTSADTALPAAPAGAMVVGKEIKPDLGESKPLEKKAGDFIIEGVPSGEHALTISKEGYANIETSVNIPVSDQNSVFVSVNDVSQGIKMSKGFDAKIVVTAEGVPVANAKVYVNSYWSRELAATTDTTGTAIFKGLPQEVGVSITVPARDTNNDGAYDYLSSYSNYNSYNGPNTVWSVALQKFRPDMYPIIIGSSCDKYPPNGSSCPVDSGIPIFFVFSIPLQIVDGDKVVLEANVPPGASPPSPKVEVAAPATMSAENVVMTLTPASALKDHHVYSFKQGLAPHFTYTSEGTLRTTAFGPLITGSHSRFYAAPAAALTKDGVSLNNRNCSNISTTASQVYLYFPKWVTDQATVKVKKVTKDGVDMPGLTPPFDVSLPNNGQTEKPGAGCVPPVDTIYYTVLLPGILLPDNTAAKKNEVQLRIVASDVQGNQVNEDLTLQVQ